MFNFQLRELSFYHTPYATRQRMVMRIIVNSYLFSVLSLMLAFGCAMFTFVSPVFVAGSVVFTITFFCLYSVDTKDPTHCDTVHCASETLHLALLFPEAVSSNIAVPKVQKLAETIFVFEKQLHDQAHVLADLLNMEVKNLEKNTSGRPRIFPGHSIHCVLYVADLLAGYDTKNIVQILYVDFGVTDPTKLAQTLDVWQKFNTAYTAYRANIPLWLLGFGVFDGFGIRSLVFNFLKIGKGKRSTKTMDKVHDLNYDFTTLS